MRVLERIDKGTFSEDSLVECKREITDTYKAARRIAGHCNAERGETVLWLIGVDEKAGITGWSSPDMAEFLPKIWSHFEGEPPITNVVNIDHKGASLTAIAFHSARPPYIVKNPEYGKPHVKGHVIDREIPWRDGTSVRTARREEVMLLLFESSLAPQIEVFGGTVMKSRFVSVGDPPPDGRVEIMIHLDFYLMPRSHHPIMIPFHRIVACFSDAQRTVSVTKFDNYRFSTVEKRNRDNARLRGVLSARRSSEVIFHDVSEDSVLVTSSEVQINRAARIQLDFEATFPASVWEDEDLFAVDLVLFSGPEKLPIRLRCDSVTKTTDED